MNSEISIPTVAIIGRPNVGKSTLFNRICGTRKAIESKTAKTTIDRIYAKANWCGKYFLLTDTAGFLIDKKISKLEKAINENVDYAIDEADLIMFIIDINEIDRADKKIAKKLHQSGKTVILVANKADNKQRELTTKEVLSLGFGEPNFISAISGRGVGDLLEKLTKLLPPSQPVEENSNEIKIAIVGRPNVGKSTLLNQIVGQKRAITDESPGTTRDTNDVMIQDKNQWYKVVDTAGIRRRGKISEGIEKYSVIRAIKAIRSSSVVLVLIDATEGLTNQDTHLVGLAKELGKSIILLVNKTDVWQDLGEAKEIEAKNNLIASLKNDLAFVPFAPVIFISGLKGTNVARILPMIKKVYSQRFKIITKDELADILSQAKNNNQQFPDSSELYQEKIDPPVFKLVIKNKNKVHFSHIRYLENIIRDCHPYEGTPIFIDLLEKVIPRRTFRERKA